LAVAVVCLPSLTACPCCAAPLCPVQGSEEPPTSAAIEGAMLDAESSQEPEREESPPLAQEQPRVGWKMQQFGALYTVLGWPRRPVRLRAVLAQHLAI
jgi:hypothetical protein